MAQSDMSVENFKSRLIGGGARNNLFKVLVTFDGIDSNQLSFMCKAASLPGSRVEPISVPFRGREIFVSGDRTFDQPWTVTVINDIDRSMKAEFEKWMHQRLNQHEKNIGNQQPATYKSVDAQVAQLRKDGSEITEMTYTFKGIFPTAVSSIDLQFSTAGEIEEFTVDFAYDYWTTSVTV